MKTSAEKTDEPPSPADRQGWRNLVAAARLAGLPPEAIVAAIHHIGPNGDQRLLTALVGHISDVMLRYLRRRVGKNHPNEGLDIIERAHGQLLVALFKPDSVDGKRMRTDFWPLMKMRTIDAIRVERRHAGRYEPYATTEEGETIEPPDRLPGNYAEEAAAVEEALKKIIDPRKQRAFRLFMEGCPLAPGKGTTSIAQELGISAKTAGAWIAEVQALLKKTGESHE